MGFNQGNSFNSNNNQQSTGGDKKKSNFRIGKIYGSDGLMDVSVWNSDKGGCYCIMSIKTAIGKDPSTGALVYQQKMSGELPSLIMNVEALRALLEGLKMSKPETCDIKLDTKRGSKISIAGSPSSVIITIENKNGQAKITVEPISVGITNVHANYFNIIDMLDIAYKKAIRNKLDPDEFAMAVGGDEALSDEAPF